MSSWLSRVLFQRKSVVSGSAVSFSEAGDARRSPADYKGFSEEGYRKCVIVFRCVNLISDACASVPMVLYRGKRTKLEKVEEHPIFDLLDRPNPMQSETEFHKAWFSYFLTSGNQYCLAVGTGGAGKGPKELWNLRPDQVKVVPGPRSLPAAFIYKPNQNEYRYDVDPITGASPINQMKSFNPTNHWYGMSPIEPGSLHVDSLNSGALWNLKLLQNSAKPSFAIKVEGQLTPEQRQEFEQSVMEKFSGAWNAGKPIVLGTGVDIEKLSFTPEEMDFLNSKNTSEKDVALVFGVPGQLVGVKDSQTFANWKEARQAFYEDTVVPLKKWQCAELNHWLVPAYGEKDLRLGIDEDALEALEPKRAERWARTEKANWMSANEKRKATGMAPYKPGDDPADWIFVPATQTPIQLSTDTYSADPLTDTEDYEGEDAPKPKPTKKPEASGSGDEGDEAGEKAFNLGSAAAKNRYLRDQDRQKLALAHAFSTKLQALFRDERDRMSAAIAKVDRSLHEFTVNRILKEGEAELARVLKAHIKTVAKHFGKTVLEQGKAVGQVLEQKGNDERFEFAIERYAEVRVDELIGQLPQKARKRILKKLKDAVDSSAGADGIPNAVDFGAVVKDAYDSFLVSRAETISRTEVHIAAEEAKRSAAKALQIPNLKKVWLSVDDDRTRDTHVEMDGTTVELDDHFNVRYSSGSDQMQGPGDKSASAENVINCRCTLAFVSKE